jgi:hypothetical protein
MASFEDQINEIDRFILRAAQSRDLLQRRLDAEAEDILQLADWNATIENIEAMDQRSAERTATLNSTRVLRDRLQSRLDLQRDTQAAAAAVVAAAEAAAVAAAADDAAGQIEGKDDDDGAEQFGDIPDRRLPPEQEMRRRLQGAHNAGTVHLGEPVVKRLVSLLLYFGHRLDGQFVGSVIRNMAWAQGRETSGIKLETDAEGHPQLKSTNTTVAEGFAKPPTNFELGLGVPHPLNRAELLVVLATLRQQAEEVVGAYDGKPEEKAELFAFVRQVCRAFHQVLQNSLAPNADSPGGKSLFEAIHKKNHGVNGVKVLRDESRLFGNAWCEICAVSGALRGEYQRLLLSDKDATVRDIAADHEELGPHGRLNLRVLRHAHLYKELLLPKHATTLLKSMSDESFEPFNRKHQQGKKQKN